MPLLDHAPRLDNRRFEDIVVEARTRIPRYTPEWTDLNDNDPGMALVQLFAWMTDMLLYRMGRVPELNYIKFLELIGIELRPAEPARTEITFPVQPGHPQPFLIVPLRQRVSAESDEGGEVIFETERALTALRARLAAVQRRQGAGYVRLTEENQQGEHAWAPFGSQPAAGDALLLGFDQALPVGVNFDLAIVGAQPRGVPEPFLCGLPPARAFLPAELRWEFWSGSAWEALVALKDDTHALTRSGHVHLRLPTGATMAAVQLGAISEPHHWLRARLLRSDYQQPPMLRAVRTNTVEAVQAETVENEVLGGSDGTPNQVFRLEQPPVLAGTLRLEVDEGDRENGGSGFREWKQVEDFLGSGPDDTHYVLNRTTGEARFGDGERGRIPVANLENAGANVVARAYRHGGGRRGNVAAGSIQSLLTSVPGVEAGGVHNPQPATGGRDEETLAEAKLRAARSLKSRCRAVTAEDFERHAIEAGDVRRARALPLYHPRFPDVPVPGVITVIVVPDVDVPMPVPTEATLRTVCAHLDQRRLLTTEVYVIGPTYRQVEVNAEVVAQNEADLAEVRDSVERSLLDYFHPLRGGEDGLGWPFGRTIFYSQVYQRVFAVAGVGRIERLTIRLDGREQPACENVPIPDGALVFSTAHDIVVNYDFELEAP